MNSASHPAVNSPIGAALGQVPGTPLGTKLLWGSVAFLGLAVLAMGATLVNLQAQNRAPAAIQTASAKIDPPALLAAVSPAAGSAASIEAVPAAIAGTQPPPTIIINNHMTPTSGNAVRVPSAVLTSRTESAAQERQATARPAPVAVPGAVVTAPVAAATPAPQVVAQAPFTTPAPAAPVVYSGYPPQMSSVPATVPATQPSVVQSPQAPLCASCGTVESVTSIQRSVQAGGTGAIAGGVLGAVVGNQIGKGSGRSIGTILGAIGGGIAGNAIEKQMKKETVYQVGVRMDDGSLRSIEQTSAPAIGSRINLDQAGANASQAGSPTPSIRPSTPGAVTVSSDRA